MLLLGLSSAFLAIDVVVVISGALQQPDKRLWVWFAGSLGKSGFRALEAVSLVGVGDHSNRYSVLAGVAGLLVTAVIFIARRLFVPAALMLATVAGCAGSAQVIKLVVDRNGPRLTPWTRLGHTFPSGTAAMAVGFFGFVGYVIYRRHLGRSRHLMLSATAVAGLALGLSAFTYHYPTEVLGGVFTGVAWLALIVFLFWKPLDAALSAGGV